jgi:hypothetical protein
MATRKPLVLVNGLPAELPAGDTLPVNAIATGTADGSKYIRDDGVLATPSNAASTPSGIYAFIAAHG